MRKTTQLFISAIGILLLVHSAAAQEVKSDSKEDSSPELLQEQRGPIEVGGRTYWGDVYGRPDLPFRPALADSKLNEYSDIRRNLYVRRARLFFDDIFGRNYFSYQTQSSFFKNQSHQATFGQYGLYKAQFVYDEIPHIYTNTARTLYTQTQPGVFTIPLAIRQSLQTASSTGTAAQINNNLPSFVATQVATNGSFFVPQIQRRAGAGTFEYDPTPAWTVGISFRREHEEGTRPIGTILNSSPSASGSSQPSAVANFQSPGVGAELPEPINYVFKTVRATTEYNRSRWTIQLGYNGSFFGSDIKSLLFDSPFATADIPVQLVPPGNGCTVTAPAQNCAIGAAPAHGQLSLYPDNKANYLNFAGAFNAGKHLRLMGSGSNGWIRQNDAFLPYTSNTAITDLEPLPARSLAGEKQTLAMNWTAVSKIGKKVQLE